MRTKTLLLWTLVPVFGALTMGCELIASVDRSKISNDEGSAGATGLSGSGGGGAAGKAGSGGSTTGGSGGAGSGGAGAGGAGAGGAGAGGAGAGGAGSGGAGSGGAGAGGGSGAGTGGAGAGGAGAGGAGTGGAGAGGAGAGGDAGAGGAGAGGDAGAGGAGAGGAGAGGAGAGGAGAGGDAGAGGAGAGGDAGAGGAGAGGDAGAGGAGAGGAGAGGAGSGGAGAGGAGAGGAGTGGGGAAGAGGAASKVIFVTSILYDGNLGGLTGADALCAARATAGSLSGTFKAWLSDSTTNAADRLNHSTDAYTLPSGTLVASNWSALISGALDHAIDETELKASVPGATSAANDMCGGTDKAVWTFTKSDGTRGTGSPCLDWTDNTAAGASVLASGGKLDALDATWTETCATTAVGACAKKAQLYCVEQ